MSRRTNKEPQYSHPPDKTVEGVDGSGKPAEKSVSLHPLKFEDAVRDLFKAKPSKTEDDKSQGGDRRQSKKPS